VKLGAKFKILKPSNGTCAYTGHTQCRSACRAATCMKLNVCHPCYLKWELWAIVARALPVRLCTALTD
jgi:hypothetical protein